MKKKYTHLFFDLDNTLWDFEVNSTKAMQETFTFFNLQTGNCKFQIFFTVFSKHNRHLWEEYRKGAVIKKELIRLRFQHTFDELNIKGIDPVEMNEHYLMEMPRQKQLVNGTEQLLEYLKSRGYKLFIITNGFSQVQHKKMETAGIKSYFSKIFISEEVKSPKPSREIFEFALKSANAPKSSSLMIGDDIDSDILGALNFGIDAVFFDVKHQIDVRIPPAKGPATPGFYHINSLSEIYTII